MPAPGKSFVGHAAQPVVSVFKKKKKKDEDESGLRSTATKLPPDIRTLSIMSWNIKMPPVKKIMVNHSLLPNPSPMQLVIKRDRRITLEIVGPNKQQDDENSAYYKLMQRTELQNDEGVSMKIYKKKSASKQDDTAAAAGGGIGALYGDEDDEDQWEEHYDFKLQDVVVLKSKGHICEVKLGVGHQTVVRDLLFEASTECTAFQEAHALLRRLEQERAERQVQLYKQTRMQQQVKASKKSKATLSRDLPVDAPLDAPLDINLLVEIVSAIDLPAADVFSSDPYVDVFMGDKKVHSTEFISKNLDPIWTLETGSLFVLSMTPEEFFSASSGMNFIVKDHDSIGSHDVLGQVHVSLDELLKGTGKREEYEIVSSLDNAKKSKSKLCLRVREATQDDIDFLEVYKKKSKAVGVYASETYLPLHPPDGKWLKRQLKKNDEKQVVHRVKPYPDPSRDREETKFMTSEQIHEDAMKQSTRWTEAGSGKLGKLYFEVIGCDRLINADFTTLDVTDKTDAFACIVYEDAIVNTDVIGDCLSPRWPSWSRRSFVFNSSHPESDLFLGIFDYDPETSPVQMLSQATSDLHDPIGRIQIKLSNFHHGTVYTLKYNLYGGESAEDRKKANGTITVRLRIEWNDLAKAFISCCMPPPQQYVSVAKKTDFEVAHFVTEGRHDEKGFSMTTFTEYIEELQSYQSLLGLFLEAFLSVWLWRGHFAVKVGRGKKVYLPLHSMTMFFWAVLVSWDFNFFPSFCFFAIGWIMLATNEYTRQSPSPWYKSRPYFGMMLRTHTTIEPNQNKLEIIEYNRAQKKKRQELEKQRAEEAKHDKALKMELGEEIEEAGAEDEDITTKKGGPIARGIAKINVNPLKPVLYPIQKKLHKAVMSSRAAGSIIRWDEPFYAYWIVTFSLLSSIMTFWLPWGFLFRWFLRIVTWVLLGPWMAIVDRIYFRENPNLTEEQKKFEIKKKLDVKYQEILTASTNYHVRKERAVKLKKMKKYMFGDFLLRVPRFSEDLYVDVPLPESSAYPYDDSQAEAVVVTDRKFGQHLKGDMIPQRDIQVPKTGSDKDIVFNMKMPDNINMVDNLHVVENKAEDVTNRGAKDGLGVLKGIFGVKEQQGRDAGKNTSESDKKTN